MLVGEVHPAAKLPAGQVGCVAVEGQVEFQAVGTNSAASSTGPEFIERTPHAPPTSVQHARVNHRRAHIAMPEQFLDRPNVIATLVRDPRRAGAL